jgi:class 3 adenylate cyclase
VVVIPDTRYARAGDLHIAFQVVGDGPFDLVFLPDWVSHLEVQWEEPRRERFLNRLASFSRLILFNPRGVGASDPVPVTDSPTAEQWMDDLRAVLDTVEADRPAVFGAGVGGAISILFAATYPEQIRALALFNCKARGTEVERGMVEEHWGDGSFLQWLAPEDASDERLRDSLARLQRFSASPGMARAIARMLFGIDVRHALPAVQAPTLVLHREGAHTSNVEQGRDLAEHIAGAVFREFPGSGHAFWASGVAPALLDEVEEFFTGTRSVGPPDRVLATVLFTDIVDSTATAAELGDQRWKERIREHDAIVRHELERHRGREIHTTGDGFLATFDGPARAIRCAEAIRDAVRRIGLEVRAGLHSGEVELQGNDIAGIAVHIAARVTALAGPSEITVSRTVVDLVAGSGLSFDDRGSHVLKGVPGDWQVFSLAG